MSEINRKSPESLQDRLEQVQELLERHRLVENLVHKQDGQHQELVEHLVHQQNLVELQRKLDELHPADVAYVLESLPLEERLAVWQLVKTERDGEILLEVSDAVRETLIADMDSHELIAAANSLDADELADLAPDLPRDIVRDPYNGFTAERIATLTRSCQRLEAQLRRLDPRFLVCAPYPEAYANATNLSKFLGVDVRPAVAATFRPSKRDDSGALANASPAARAAFGLLEGCSRALDAVCSSL